MSSTLKFEVKGADKLMRQLKTLGERVARKVHRQAVTAAVRPLRKAVKSHVPVDSGALKASIASKVFGKGFQINGIVGSDVSKTRDKTGEGEQTVSRELHLVEFGFQHHDGTTVAGQFPLTKGFEESHKDCEDAYTARMKAGIEREANK